MVMTSTWTPDPTNTDSSMPLCGGRNTSPWTNFQPNSSCASSPESIWKKKNNKTFVYSIGSINNNSFIIQNTIY